jgi:hypothetical protein
MRSLKRFATRQRRISPTKSSLIPTTIIAMISQKVLKEVAEVDKEVEEEASITIIVEVVHNNDPTTTQFELN